MKFINPTQKYQNYPPIDLPDRTWPSRHLKKVPIWCSVDLRDGNQALVQPMNLKEKLKLFQLLVEMGFKEIEIGFPSASKLEYDFTRILIEENYIPDDVTVQVLTQAREALIEKTYEALKGVKRAIIHVYNSTSELQRRVVFKKDKQSILNLAVQGAKWVKERSSSLQGSEIIYQYSPESFTGTELNYALEVCTAVMEEWKPTIDHKMILNLPATVEMSSPNVYADQIEWMCQHLPGREKVIISTHTHNDRGTGVAAAELSLLAGSDRIEGTLFGNGERTGNCDLLTLALNFFSLGISPKLNFSPINQIVETYETCTKLQVHPRHPYAGDLVYTAFSGSHQDAIAKGMKALKTSKTGYWEVPYLPIDPEDLGRSYESIIRVNSQSGKGGSVYLLEREFGFSLPKEMQMEFGKVIQSFLDKENVEVSPQKIWEIFSNEYLERNEPLIFNSLDHIHTVEKDKKEVQATLTLNGETIQVKGEGTGILHAFIEGLSKKIKVALNILSYEEHSLGEGSDVAAVAYLKVNIKNKKILFGLGVNEDITLAAIQAVISAYNRFEKNFADSNA
ncbi:MAG: 2-isopropylmalate synthase [Chlamydiae bacterium]|nr:2-isopropylmalate synthase [Chlamydiota bacterium]